MNREQFLKYLEVKSGSCECPDLAELFKKRNSAISLEKQCDALKAGLDLINPRPQDEAKLIRYGELATTFQMAVADYHLILSDLAQKGKVNLIQYGSEKQIRKGAISITQASTLPKDSLIAAECGRCHQQFDIVRDFRRSGGQGYSQ